MSEECFFVTELLLLWSWSMLIYIDTVTLMFTYMDIHSLILDRCLSFLLLLVSNCRLQVYIYRYISLWWGSWCNVIKIFNFIYVDSKIFSNWLTVTFRCISTGISINCHLKVYIYWYFKTIYCRELHKLL